ncbi:hypothetical protein JCM5296_006716 [Sporobolomyces johnsonii]
MPPPQAGSIAARLHRALAQIHTAPPRLIASPVVQGGVPTGASRRASVAIIIRLRPDHPPPSSTAASSPHTSPLSPHPPLHSSPPQSPEPSPSPPPLPYVPSPSGLAESPSTSSLSAPPPVLSQLEEFFALPWVNDPRTTVEILYIKRATRTSDKWSGHVAFPGGRQEPEDESAEFTALRETWEEVGLDLAEKEWISIGQLDDREITTSLGKRLLMILSPFVFLHTSPHAPLPELQETEVASAHWIPLDLLHSPAARYGSVEIDIASRLAPRNRVARAALQMLVGKMYFKCILLPNDPVAVGQLQPDVPPGAELPDLRLWGLTLGMTLDLLSHMTLSSSPADLSTYPYAIAALEGGDSKKKQDVSPFAPSEASVFPRFSYPDINLLIWLFGWRYRRLLAHRSSSASSQRLPETPRPRTPGGATQRVNWQGMSLGAYYGAVRRALVVAVLMRAVAALGAVAGVVWWVKGWWAGRRRGLGKR